MRSLMFVPSHRERMIERALAHEELDIAILDLEDGVPPDEKTAARAQVPRALAETGARPLRYVRVNAVASGVLGADLDAAVRPGLAGIVLPKVDSAEELAEAIRLLAEREAAVGCGQVALVASVESARGLLAAPAIAATPRVTALLFGAEDFALDLGLPAEREAEASELLHARSAVVVAAAAARRAAIDGIWPDLEDADGLRRDALRARRLGFTGKSLIHPSQIEAINECFTPTAAEVDRARRVIDAFDVARSAGKGAVALDGTLLDPPIVERARRVVDAHEAIVRK